MLKPTVVMAALAISLVSPKCIVAQSTAAAYGAGGQTTQPAESGRYELNHAELGVYADYFRLAPAGTSTNYVGVGGRVAFNVQPNLALEGELNYDFARNYSTSFTVPNGTTTTTTFVRSSVRPITGLFGPKLQFGTSSPFRVFVTGKLGFLDFSTTSPTTVTGSQFTGAVSGIGGSGTHLAFYPGGGFEGFFGPIGLRAEAGDEIYLNNGTFNNLRVTVGPTLRF
jgi:hypothetical protein